MKIKLFILTLLMLASTAWAGQVEDEAAYNRAAVALQRGDYATFLQLMQQLAAQGESIAQTNLGLIYEKGQGIAQDPAEAAKWYRLAAAQGNAEAQSLLGSKYVIGHGVVKNYAEALKWLRLAAAQGDADAQYLLGTMYNNGQGVIQDYKETAKWMRLAAGQGDAGAQYGLGLMYSIGRGVSQNNVRAHAWFNLAATSGNVAAVESRDFVANQMTSQQIGEAQKLARDCLARNLKGCN